MMALTAAIKILIENAGGDYVPIDLMVVKSKLNEFQRLRRRVSNSLNLPL